MMLKGNEWILLIFMYSSLYACVSDFIVDFFFFGLFYFGVSFFFFLGLSD